MAPASAFIHNVLVMHDFLHIDRRPYRSSDLNHVEALTTPAQIPRLEQKIFLSAP